MGYLHSILLKFDKPVLQLIKEGVWLEGFLVIFCFQ